MQRSNNKSPRQILWFLTGPSTRRNDDCRRHTTWSLRDRSVTRRGSIVRCKSCGIAFQECRKNIAAARCPLYSLGPPIRREVNSLVRNYFFCPSRVRDLTIIQRDFHDFCLSIL